MFESRDSSGVIGTAAALLCLAASAVPAAGQQWVETNAVRQVDDQSRLDIYVSFGAGRLEILPGEPGQLYGVRMRYDGSVYEPIRRFRSEDGRASLRLGVNPRSDTEGFSISLKPWDFHISLGGLENAGDRPSQMRLELTRDVPTELRINAGASENELSLGGIPLRRLAVQTGASETEIAFDRPNPVAMGEMTIEAGIAELRAIGLGNARFESLRVKGGIGDVTLDFTGEWRRSARASVRMGLGSLTLRFPENLGVQLDRKTLLSSFTAVGFVRQDGSYRTTNWSTAEHRLELELDGALSSVDVEVVRP